MEQSKIVLLILIAALILFITEKIPTSITVILAVTAMGAAGVLSFEEAFSGFGHTATLMVIGMGIIGESFFTTGLSEKIGKILCRFKGMQPRYFVLVLFVLGMVMSAFFNAMCVIAIFMPIVDCLVVKPETQLSRKHTYLPLGIATVLGSNLTIISSSSLVNTSSLLANSYYGRSLSFFEPAVLGLPACAAVVLFYALFGYKLQNRIFNFEEDNKASGENMALGKKREAEQRPEKMRIVVLVMAVCIFCFISGLNIGVVSLAGASILIITGCIGEKEAYKSVSWPTVFIVAGSIGMAKGVEASGTGQMIADTILQLFGRYSDSAFGMCIVILLISTILSNLMSNNATVAIVVPISLMLAKEMGVDALPFVLAAGVGATTAMATPICTAPITITAVAGYRFRDYFLFGGILNIITTFMVSLSLYLRFFMR